MLELCSVDVDDADDVDDDDDDAHDIQHNGKT
jgi:hypothetical protein